VRAAFAWAVILPVSVLGWVVAFIDRLLGVSLWFPRDFPALERRRDWLVRALKKSGALPRDATVREVTVAPISSTVAFRSSSGFVTVAYDDGATLDCFVKLAPTAGSVWNRAVFNMQFNSLKEVAFNALAVRPDASLPAPRPYCTYVAPVTGNQCLVTERLHDVVEYGENVEAVSTEYLRLALEGFATLHARFWQQRVGYVSGIGSVTVSWFDSLVAFRWAKTTRRLLVRSWTHCNAPQTVIHGDARIGNMLFPTGPRGRFVLFDWQAVRQGRAAFDLAYFFVLSLTPEQRRLHEARALDDYHRLLLAGGVTGFSREQLEDDYRHACLCVAVLLSLPLLSGEASADPKDLHVLAYGLKLWLERLKAKLEQDFDYAWVERHYGMAETEARAAIAEMLGTIERRLASLQAQQPL
jgi:hypothetical protein